jgi:hypothetical protein
LTSNLLIVMSRSLVAIFLLAVLAGCATTQTSIHVVGSKPPLCQAQSGQESALVLWGTVWRDDQKEAQLREDMASKAIAEFFGSRSCYSTVTILRSIAGREAVTLSDVDVLKFANTLPEKFSRVIILRVEELGPLLIFYLSPVLWEGGTEAVLRVRVLDAGASALDSDLDVHWKNSGAFVLKGTKSLEQDLQSALAKVFLNQ